MTSDISRRTLLRSTVAGAGAVVGGSWLWSGSAAAAPVPAAVAPSPPPVDAITFGDAASESAHEFVGVSTTVVEGAHGQQARVAASLAPPKSHLGDLRFVAQVDPARQNYLTLKFWGEDTSSYRTVVFINGEQANYRQNGDYEPINVGTGKGLEGRFYVATTMLPLPSTQGHDRVEIIVRTYHASLTGVATENSRRYHEAYLHTTPKVDLADRDGTGYAPSTKAAPALTPEEEQAQIDRFRTTQIDLWGALSAKSDASPSATLSIVRYQDELRFYAEALLMDWSPASTPEQQRLALERIFKSIDNFTKQYYGNVLSLGNGGHQSDWGGYYGALGEALYIVENLIADDTVYGAARFAELLAAPFETGTTDGPNSIAGGGLTRGQAWERVLKANFDFARSRLSYIYNQVMYCYEGAWKAHEGLRVIGSTCYEGKRRSHAIAGEALGWVPFLGEEVLVGPDGAELDLYHSLFHHDNNAFYTDDYRQTVMKGLAKSKLDSKGQVVRRLPYGTHYTGITRDGLTRENTYVANYGESANYLTSWFFRTLNHRGDEKLNDEILKLALRNIHARGQTRYAGTDAAGNRVMLAQQVVDERNSAYPGRVAYATDVNTGRGLAYASLEQYMAEHADRYAGCEWAAHRQYAREAVGFAQQQLVDNQYFPYFSFVLSNHKYDLRLPKTYAYVTRERGPAGGVLPHTDLARYTDAELARLGVDRAAASGRFAWVDIDNMFVSVRDGDTHLFGSLFERNRGYTANGRLHAQHGGYDQLVQLETQGVLDYRDHLLRAGAVEDPMVYDRYTAPDRPLALTGELAPVAYQPGVGTINRDNWMPDNSYSGYPNLLTARYGQYLMAVNTTRPEYGNARAYPVGVPGGVFRVFDLVSRRELPVVHGAVLVAPTSAVVLTLGTDGVEPAAPSTVDVVVATPGTRAVGLTWRPARGATSYTISRATRESGPFVAVARGVRGASHVDPTPSADATYFYQVTPVNERGAGRASTVVKAVVAPGGLPGGTWRRDAIGTPARGSSSVDGGTIAVSGGSGRGFGGGDDSVIYDRFHADSFTMVSRLAHGGVAVSARLGHVSGAVGGVILRDDTAPVGRYVYLGADSSGALSLGYRAVDSRADIGTGVPGQNAAGGVTRSPYVVDLSGFTAAGHPYVKLVRPADSHRVLALVSADGRDWVYAGEATVPMLDVVHAGVACDRAATFTQVAVAALAPGALVAGGRFNERTGTVFWTKPRAAIAFDLYRTRDPQVAATDPRTGGSWERLLDNAWALSYEDTVHGGQMYYKVVARRVDGGTSVTAEPASITAESFATVLGKARSVPAENYTAASFAAFTAEVDAAEQASHEPGADEAALIKRVYDAYELLVPAFRHSFEATDPDVWQAAGSGPYTRIVADDYGRTGGRSLYFASTDTTGSASFNMSFNSRKQGTSPIQVRPGTAYKVSFWYQLKDYRPGSGVGAYYFIRSHSAGNGVGTEQRNWLPAGDTPAGEWRLFERTYTTVTDASVDNVAIDVGFRGSYGEFRVDDVRVEPAA